MVKKISIIALAGLMVIPSIACAASNAELEAKIERLSQEFEAKISELHQQMAKQTESITTFEEKSDAWDTASRIQLSGDFRSRADFNHTSVPTYWNAREVAGAMRFYGMVTEGSTAQQIQGAFNAFSSLPEATQLAMMAGAGATPQQAHDLENDTMYSTRLRLNIRAKATENVEVKARIVGYKTWGMQGSPFPEEDDGVYSPYFLTSRSFDGTSGRTPDGNKLLLDRAIMNWNNIGGAPIWFSIGRRPTSDGPPAHLRLGSDERMATPLSYMDYPFDGLTLGYAYRNLFGMEDSPGRIRFCYGRGFEAGPNAEDSGMNDVDFAGISWDIYKKGDRFLYFQSYGAFNIFNVPGDTVYPNPIEYAAANDNDATDATPDISYYGSDDIYLDRVNLGDIFHTSALYMDKAQNLNYFLTLGWSHTEARGIDELGASLLGSWGAEPEDKDGYGVYAGIRYDMEDAGLKLGAEFNWGSENWLGFTPGHDDMYASKLYTRGKVYEVYGIYDLPTGEAISKYGKAFLRLGYQHYDYDYTYSGMWLGTPADIDALDSPLNAQFYAPMESMDQIYLTIEAYF